MINPSCIDQPQTSSQLASLTMTSINDADNADVSGDQLRLEVSREVTRRYAAPWLERMAWQTDQFTDPQRVALWDLRGFFLAARDEVFRPTDFGQRKARLDQWLFSLSRAFQGEAPSDAAAAVAATVSRFNVPRAHLYEALSALESNLYRERLNTARDLLRLSYRQTASFTMAVGSVLSLDSPADRQYFIALGMGAGMLDVLWDWPHWEVSHWLPIPSQWVSQVGSVGQRLVPPDPAGRPRLSEELRRVQLPELWRQMATLGIEILGQAAPTPAIADSAVAANLEQWRTQSLDHLHALYQEPDRLL